MATVPVNDTTPRNQYTASASQTIFDYDFITFLTGPTGSQSSNLDVYVDDTLQTEGSDYTVTGQGTEDGGTVVFTTGRTAGEIITIIGNIAIERLTDLQQGGRFEPDTYNLEQDKQTAMMKQIKRDIDRKVGLSDTSTVAASSIVIPDPVANKGLKWNSSGNALENTTYDLDTQQAAAAASATAAAGSAAAAEASASAASTSETNSATSETNASNSADLAESWAVDPIGSRPEGSAKYWAEQAAATVVDNMVQDLTASGAVTQGEIAVQNSDGTVSAVGENPLEISDQSTNAVINAGSQEGATAFYDASTDRAVAVGRTSSSIVAYLISNDGSSFTIEDSATLASTNVDSCSISGNGSGELVVTYEDATAGDSKAVVLNITTSAISAGSPTTVNAGSDQSYVFYDSTNSKYVFVYADESTRDFTATVGTTSALTISFGTTQVLSSGVGSGAASTFSVCGVHDVDNGSNLIAVVDGQDTDKGKAFVGTISGTTISFGTGVEFEASAVRESSQLSGEPNTISMAYDTTNDKVIIVYAMASGQAKINYGTISGTSVSFGTAETVGAETGGGDNWFAGLYYDSTNDVFVVTYDFSTTQVGVKSVTFNGTAFTQNTATNLAVGGDPRSGWLFKSASGGLQFYACISSTSIRGVLLTYGDNANDWIGIFQETKLDTETVKVGMRGRVDTFQSGLTPLTTYYVDTDGTLTSTNTGAAREVGVAISATRILTKGV